MNDYQRDAMSTDNAGEGHRYHVVDGQGGQCLCETTDQYPDPSPIGLVDAILAEHPVTPAEPEAGDGLTEADREALAKTEFTTWAGQGEGYGIEWADHLDA